MEEHNEREARDRAAKRSLLARGRALIRSAQDWVGRIELSLLVSVALVAAGVLLFTVIADELVAEGPRSFDTEILLALREPNDLQDPIGPPWLEVAVRDLTALGGATVLLLASIGVITYLALRRRWYLVGLVLLTVVGAMLLTVLLKQLFGRLRPDIVPPLINLGTPSFPSGHSSLSATIYLTLGTLIARLQGRRGLRVYVMGYAVLITLLVGFSRVYLGVHWPSDVLGGWILGAVWAVLMSLVARWWRRRARAAHSPQKG